MAEQSSRPRSHHEKMAKSAPQLAELEREVNRLVKEREAMKAAHKETLRKEIDQRDRSLKKMSRDLFSAEEQLKNLEDQVRTLQRELRDRSDRMNEMRSEHEQQLEAVLKKSKSDSHQQMGEIQRKDREIAEMNRQLNDIKKMKDYMEEKFLQASTPTGSRPSTPKKSDTSDEPTPVSKSPREDTLLIKNSELSFLAKTLRDDNDKIKKEKALLQEKLDRAYKELEPMKKRTAGYDKRVTDLTGTLYSKEKQLKQLTEELAETKAAKLQSSTPDRPKPHDKSMIVELQKAQRQLQAKTKELTALAGEADRLRKEKTKLEEEAKKFNREKAEKRMVQLLAAPRPKPQESPTTRKLEDENKRLEKELQERNLELRRSKGKHQARANDLESSLKRRDKHLKELHDYNLKLKVANQMLEEQRDRHVSIDEWTKSKTEVDHAKINQLKQENMRLQERLRACSTSPSPTFLATTSSPIPLSPLSGSPDYHMHSPTSPPDHRPLSPDVSIDEFGSMWSLTSNESVLQERVDQLRYDHDELTIKYEEMKEEYGNVKNQYSKLRERYQQLLHKSRQMQTTYKQCQTEQLQLERECTRLRQGGEFDIKREEHLRSQLEMTTRSMQEQLQDALKKENEKVTELQTLISDKQKATEELKSTLAGKEEELHEERVVMAALRRELEVLHQQQQPSAASNTQQLLYQQLDDDRSHVDSSLPVATPRDSSSPTVVVHDSSSQTEIISHDHNSLWPTGVTEHHTSKTSTLLCNSSSQTVGIPRSPQTVATTQQYSSSQTVDLPSPHPIVAATEHDSSSQTASTHPTTNQDSSSPSSSITATHDHMLPPTPHDHSAAVAAPEQNFGNTQLLASIQDIIGKLSKKLKEDDKYRSIQGLIEQLQSLLIHEECDYSAAANISSDTNRTSPDDEEDMVDGGDMVGSITGDRFQHWLSQYEAERNSLKSQVCDLESRLSMGSQRVMELQGLVGELEGRLATEQSLNFSSALGDRRTRTPVAATPTLTLQEENRLVHTTNPATVHVVQEPRGHVPSSATAAQEAVDTMIHAPSSALQQDMSQSPPSTPHIPFGLGQRLKETLSHTKQAVSHRSWPGVEEELAVLESLLAELLHNIPSPDYTPYLPSVKGPQTSSPLRPSSPQSLNAREQLSNIQDPVTYTHTSYQLDQTPQFVAAHHNMQTSEPTVQPMAARRMVHDTPPPKVLQLDNADRILSQPPTEKNDRIFVVLFDYDPYSLCNTGHPEKELTLHTGDVIAVHGEMDHDGYCKATFGDQCGLVPRSFIEEMELTDSQAEQRLLNQSLSSPTPCPSAVSSVIDIVPSYDSRRAAPPSTVSSVSSLSTASTIIKSPPEPPSQFHVERAVIKSGLLMRWKAPQTDVHGRSNGCTVKGYIIQCDGVATKQILQPLQTKVLVEEVSTSKPHTLTIVTITMEGLSSQPAITRYPGVAMAQALYNYDPRADSPNPNPDLELSFKEGQIITIYGDKMEDGYYQGQLDEKNGVVPSNFVRVISPSGDGAVRGSHVSPSGYRRKLFDSPDSVV